MNLARAGLLAVLSGATAVLAADSRPVTIVFCSPGSPGTTEEAQGAMDAFAAAVTQASGFHPGALMATYEASEEAGVARLKKPDAALALVSLPFFLEHERALGLHAEKLLPVPVGGNGEETWTLVAAKGRVTGPASLEGYTLLSTSGYSPRFVAGTALGHFGRLPASTRIAPTLAVLSALRKAASGEKIAVLLDGEQAAALSSLAFASQLETVARSPALPIGVLVKVGNRVPRDRLSRIEAGLMDLQKRPDGAEALAGIRMQRFVPANPRALSEAQRAFREASP